MRPITQESDRLGFVGIGYMGRPIARRLLESGFKLTAYDRDHSKIEELIQYGGPVAQSVSELSSTCNVVLSCLPSDEAVLNTYKGPDGVFANAHRGSRVIDRISRDLAGTLQTGFRAWSRGSRRDDIGGADSRFGDAHSLAASKEIILRLSTAFVTTGRIPFLQLCGV
jgi:hypothetical protein